IGGVRVAVIAEGEDRSTRPDDNAVAGVARYRRFGNVGCCAAGVEPDQVVAQPRVDQGDYETGQCRTQYTGAVRVAGRDAVDHRPAQAAAAHRLRVDVDRMLVVAATWSATPAAAISEISRICIPCHLWECWADATPPNYPRMPLLTSGPYAPSTHSSRGNYRY